MANAETKLQHQILEYLKLRNILSWRNNSGQLKIKSYIINLSPKGSPDIIGILPNGRFLGIEVKMPRESLTPDQNAFCRLLKDNGAAVFVARSVSDVERELNFCMEK